LREDRHVGPRGTLLLALALFSAAPARAVLVKDNLYGVKALSASEAWTVGNFGSIYHTTDGGRTWEPSESGTKVPLFAVDFVTGPGGQATEGWAVGKSSTILHTANGGRTWKRQASAVPVEKHLFYVEAIDARTVWAVGDWGAIEVTHDGGATWEDRSLGTITVKVDESASRVTSTLTDDVILYAVSFPDPRHGFVVGEFGTVLATSDGGTTWEKREVGTEKTLFGARFTSAEEGWAVGIDGLILHTRDGGWTWTVQHGSARAESIEELGFLETLKNPGLYDVDVSGRYGIVVGDTGNVLTTSDGGETWTDAELPESQRLVWMRAVSLAPGTHGFTVGAGGFAATIDQDRVVLPARP
jgi:photosystem II stability/assembly factor-like uncharacterized protein